MTGTLAVQNHQTIVTVIGGGNREAVATLKFQGSP